MKDEELDDDSMAEWNSGKLDVECLICAEKYQMPQYGEGKCPKCGQVFRYDEGVFLVLSDAQLNALRRFAGMPEKLSPHQKPDEV